ncbi:DNA topoisomerase 1 [Taenia solium]|eukprot:TsM_000850700 transcript=TsM_000850700 gene=TsM_000850700
MAISDIMNMNNGNSHDIKNEDDDVPLASRISLKRTYSSSDDDDVPLATKNRGKGSTMILYLIIRQKKRPKSEPTSNDIKIKPERSPFKNDIKSKSATSTPRKRTKEEEGETVWKWWEEKNSDGKYKWRFLEHNGPLFAPPYVPLPENVPFFYDGQRIKLSEAAEEVAGFYAKMLDHDYTKMEVFNNNFFKDWQRVMTPEEKQTIRKLSKCDFTYYAEYYKKKAEERKNMSKEEKQRIKEENQRTVEQYGFCVLDGHKQRIANFRIEPPGLFRGRGNHPKTGTLKKRILPEDVIINCSKGSKVPSPPGGHRWKEVRHDNTVTWLACWVENVQNNFKYVMLNASSRLKGEKDWKKYEVARRLHSCVDKIRADYRADFKSKEMRVRQRAVALYFIDKLALRAGNEKDEDEADTVGCCSLRCEHIKLHEELDGKPYVVEFDFPGKDSIRYQNSVSVPKRVFKNLKIFIENKQGSDDLFDRLNTTTLNQYLRELMDGLTAKVFRTYNASRTLEEQLEHLTNPDDIPAEKVLAYNRANRAVAVLCNHQRAVPKSFSTSMENLQKKIDAKKEQIAGVMQEARQIKADYSHSKTAAKRAQYEKLKKRLSTLKEQLLKLQVQATDRDENKTIALSTSKLNYLDPRITVAWCKRYNIPIEKVYNRTQREKFMWAIQMATENYKFTDLTSDRGTNQLKQEDEEEPDDEAGDEDDF